ncbi:MAG TPA: hypothetical protein VMS17_07915, partial [Gemmataceae bacterium]|nr:hypothetical protein [Gemmataceae bacterium]
MSASTSPFADEQLVPDPRDPAAPKPAGPTRAAESAALRAWKNVAGYAAAACLAMAAAATVLRLWHADLRVPLFEMGDALTVEMTIHSIQETGWFLDNSRLGAPGAQDLREYPSADVLHYATLKLLLIAFHDPGVVFNVFILLPFPLTAVSAYFVFRRLRLGRLTALVPSVLYACTLYHFLRIGGHAFLAAYYLLPPMLWVALRASLGRSPLLQAESPGGRPRWRLLSGQAAGAAALCILTGLAGL